MPTLSHIRHYGLGEHNLAQCWPDASTRPILGQQNGFVALGVPRRCYTVATQPLGWWRPFPAIECQVGQKLAYELEIDADKAAVAFCNAREQSSPKLPSWVLSVSVEHAGGIQQPDKALQLVNAFQPRQTIRGYCWRTEKDGRSSLQIAVYFRGMEGGDAVPDRDLVLRFANIRFEKE